MQCVHQNSRILLPTGRHNPMRLFDRSHGRIPKELDHDAHAQLAAFLAQRGEMIDHPPPFRIRSYRDDKPGTQARTRLKRALAPLERRPAIQPDASHVEQRYPIVPQRTGDIPEQPGLLGKRRLGVAGPPRKLQADVRKPGRGRRGNLFERRGTGQCQPAQ